MRLYYLVKLKIRVFVKLLMLEKRNSRNLLIDFYFTYWKRCKFTVLLTVVHLQSATAKFHKVGYRRYSGEAENVYISVRQIYQDNVYKILSQSVRFCRLYIKKKHFGVFFFSSQCSSLLPACLLRCSAQLLLLRPISFANIGLPALHLFQLRCQLVCFIQALLCLSHVVRL